MPLGDQDPGDTDLPPASRSPFRALASDETCTCAIRSPRTSPERPLFWGFGDREAQDKNCPPLRDRRSRRHPRMRCTGNAATWFRPAPARYYGRATRSQAEATIRRSAQKGAPLSDVSRITPPSATLTLIPPRRGPPHRSIVAGATERRPGPRGHEAPSEPSLPWRRVKLVADVRVVRCGARTGELRIFRSCVSSRIRLLDSSRPLASLAPWRLGGSEAAVARVLPLRALAGAVGRAGAAEAAEAAAAARRCPRRR